MGWFRDFKKDDWLLDAVLKIHSGHEENDATEADIFAYFKSNLFVICK